MRGKVEFRESIRKEKDGKRAALLASTVNHLEGKYQRDLAGLHRHTDATAWDIHHLEPSNVRVVYNFELNDGNKTHLRTRQMSPKHYAVVKKDVKEVLEVKVITPVSSAWSFTVVTVTKKE